MMRLIRNDKPLTEKEIYDYVHSYKKSMETDTKSRYFEILKLIPESKYGLDYGCGWGAFTKLISEKGNNVIGLDLSQNEIDICNHCWHGENLTFTAKPIVELTDNEFDFVVSNQVIEHTHNPGNYLQQINRITKENGKLIISIPNVMNPRFLFPLLSKNLESRLVKTSQSILKNYEKTHVHIQAWDPLHFVRLVSSVGYELEKFVPLEGMPLPWLVQKLRIPAYLYPKGRMKNWSYSMVFSFRKVRNSEIKDND